MTINAEQIPAVNRLTVLKCINQKDPFTRMDVVRKANLSLPTVNNILASLTKEDYIIEIGNDKSRGGRPPTLYQFNPKARYTIGVEIRIPRISIGLVDLQEKLVALQEYRFEDDATSDYVIQTLQNGIVNILRSQNVSASKLVGIGLGVPGFVERDSGLWLRYLRVPNVRDVKLGEALYEQFGVPIYIQNEANVYALAEQKYGNLQPKDDVIFITWSEGVKASVVIDGRLIRGRFGNFGAIGHFIVEENGHPCYCGARGCLEMYASEYAFREKIKFKLGQGLLKTDAELTLQPGTVFKRAAAGDAFCQEIVEESIPYQASAFASLIRLTDISQMVLLGTYTNGGDYLLNLLYDSMAERLPGVIKRNLSIHLGNEHQMDTIVQAAASLAVEGHFELQPSP